jgi:MMP 1-O-methyltransferase
VTLSEADHVTSVAGPVAGPLGESLAASLAASLAVASAAKGFMPDDEAATLRAAAQSAPSGVMLEVGSYCGKSAVHLGVVARERGLVLFSVDHHRGSEENQSGWEWHDTDVVDTRINKMDTLPFFRATIHDAGLEGTVVAVVGPSTAVARSWTTPLSFLFIDGGHGRDVAHADFDGWVPRVAPGGFLAIHDVFPNPADGGRPPYELFLRALNGGFEPLPEYTVGSVRVLRRSHKLAEE